MRRHSIRGLKVIKFHNLVFSWFQKNGRNLPWRKTTDPYAIALSEIMLQQTQVDRVIPKWHAFLGAFPTWSALASARTSDVLRMWKGLGYNRRAVMLHRLAKAVVASGEAQGERGELPNDIAAMKKLPGIGEYTANAIAAFAFRNVEAAPVDTNIVRILKRVFPRQTKDRQSIERLAYSIRPEDVWTWNHALMDIGALECTARGHVSGLCVLGELHGDVEKRMRNRSRLKNTLLENRRGSHAPHKRFEDTDRYYRGRIVDLLREGAMTMKGMRTNVLFSRIDDERFATLLQGVMNEGIVERYRNTVFLAGDK